MASQMASRPALPTALVASLVNAEGSGTHGYLTSHDLLAGRHTARNLADAVHHIAILHGRHPGVADHAVNHTQVDSARAWLFTTADAFMKERSFLNRLIVAVGPMPSTPGQDRSESAVNAQRHAVDMLAQSDRNGCALGAALALSLDWPSIRDVLISSARRFGVDAPDLALSSAEATNAVAIEASSSSARARRILIPI
jgi:hypothetical protein